jgi:hypothetical protein
LTITRSRCTSSVSPPRSRSGISTADPARSVPTGLISIQRPAQVSNTPAIGPSRAANPRPCTATMIAVASPDVSAQTGQ